MNHLVALDMSLISLTSLSTVAAVFTPIIALICLVAVVKAKGREGAREAQLLRLQAELKIFTDTAITVGARLARTVRAPSLVTPASSAARQSEHLSEQALDLAQRGAGIDDLVAACDLSRSEAGLVLALQRRNTRVRSAA